ncbi:MAG: class GN sortase [Thiotrichales bacterium]|nr:MAG: class GN sortase [Thiotrichales bacterium]
MNAEHRLTFVFIMLAVAALWQMGLGAWIHTKAFAAQVLLDHAWQQTLIEQKPNRPWPWADTWPVAELIVPGLDVSRIVLAGDSGESLAFGPGHSFASAMPEERGTVLISGHRDTHFGFLQNLKKGERLILKTRSGIHYYTVRKMQVVDSRLYKADAANDELILVTCYPFNSAISGGSQRYLVHAQRERTFDGTTLISRRDAEHAEVVYSLAIVKQS